MAGVAPVNPKFTFTEAPAGSLDVYLAGTTTRTTTWQDSTQLTENENPISLNARGECSIYLDPDLTYKFALKNAGGVTIWTQDNIKGADAGLRSDLSSSGGADLVHFLQSGTGAVAQTVQDKLRELPSPEDFGAVGDGATDDATALLNAANAAVAAGRPLSLNGSKTYAVSSLALPAGLHLQTNGATFQPTATTTSNSPLITLAADVQVHGPLKVVIPAGMRRDRVMTAPAAGCVFDDIDVSSVDQQANTTDNDDAAVRFSGADNVRFGRLRVANFDQAVQFKTCVAPAGGRFDITSYTRAVHIEDTTCMRMACGGWIRTTSPNAIYTPGHVGVLMSATTDDATSDCVIPNLLVEDSAEHGVRVAGPGRISDCHFPGLTTKNTGGSGLKILGTDAGVPTSRNKNITFHGATFEDCGSGAYTTNMCGVLALYCDGVYGDNIKVRKNGKLYSAHTAVRLAACTDVRINGDLGDAQFEGAWLDGSLGDLDRVDIRGISRTNGRDGYRLTAGTATIRRATTDLNCDSNTGNGLNIAIGAGTLVDSLFRAKVYNNTGGAAACDNAAATLDVVGAVGATPLAGITAANGSRWSDGATLNYRKAGAWTAL